MIGRIQELERQLAIRIPNVHSVDSSIDISNTEARLAAISDELFTLLLTIKTLFPCIHTSAVQMNKEQAILFTESEIKIVPVASLYDLPTVYILTQEDIWIHISFFLNLRPFVYSN